jgi:hypothetical protein
MAVCAYRILNCLKFISQDGIVDGSKELSLRALHMNEMRLLWLWIDLFPQTPTTQNNKE